MSLTAAASTVACSPHTMDWRERERRQNRGTILVASTNRAWAGIVTAMVVDSGYRPAYPTEREAPWLSVARTQPCIAICDYGAAAEGIQQLVLEAWARHIPVLVSTTEQSVVARLLKPRRVARFRLPVSYEAFRLMLDELLPSVPARRAARDDERRGSRRAVGVRKHILPIGRRDRSRPGHLESAPIDHSDAADNARADDDGMVVSARA
jgi:hypothetical protein